MNVERVLPEPHKYAVCAPDDTPIKEFYKDYFEEIFIFFHPFIKTNSINPELFSSEIYPNKFDIIENCEILTWKTFLNLSGISNYKELDIGLRSGIHGLNRKYERKDLATIIDSVCEKKSIIPPTEGYFPSLLINKLLNSIKNEGYTWIWKGDEFCTERKLEYIDDLINVRDTERCNLFTSDNTILLTTHWDSHFSLVCSKKGITRRIVEFCDLEGFYCNDRTQIYWSLRDE